MIHGCESDHERATIERLRLLGYEYLPGPDIDRDEKDVVLREVLKSNLRYRYPLLSEGDLDLTVDKIARPGGVDKNSGTTRYSTTVHDLNKRITFVGSMNIDAALYDSPVQSGQGRPRKKGKRLLSLRQLAASDHIKWKLHEIVLYGRKVKVLIKTQCRLWYTVSGSKPIRMIVTRDPKGRFDDRAYFITDAQIGVSELSQLFSLRWTQEEMHRNVKQHLGLEDPQNGWWRIPNGERRNQNIPGKFRCSNTKS